MAALAAFAGVHGLLIGTWGDVGANDGDWQPEVKETHDALAAAGIESVYVEFAGEGHIVGADFDASVFFDFWAKH